MPFIAPKSENVAKIKVIGVGGGGQNAINTMIDMNETIGVEFIAMNTDLQALNSSAASIKLQLGPDRTHGLGSGADPSVGMESALESTEDIRQMLDGADMVFLAAGLGGGTGTGAGPVVAQIARDLGILTVGVVTKPFSFEGKRRMAQAEEGIDQLRNRVDALIVIPNEKLLDVIEEKTSMNDAFKIVDKVVGNAVKGISDLITSSGLINVDFADVKSIMSNAGSALMGIGAASGENRAEKAANMAINSPLLGIDIKGSTGILMNIIGDSSLTMHEVNKAAKIVSECANDNANIIFGASIDPTIEGIRVTVIATGFDNELRNNLMTSSSVAMSDRDIIDQIDSRFDSIKKKPNELVEEEVVEDPFDDEDEDIGPVSEERKESATDFDFNKLREEVKRMEKTEKKKSDKKESPKEVEKDEEDDSDSKQSGGFWNFIMDR